ncbi:Ribonuclease III [uncultured virus]|nr:Ribonuclease III [uncultured virus]
MATTNQTQWLQRLQLFINKTLQPIIPDKKLRDRYLDKNAMVIWVRAFTHETVSPSDNYEDLEYAGDAVLKWAFPKYLGRRLPYLHKGEYTELNVAYMSKINQAQLAREMGLSEFVRVAGIDRAILNLETDVFESFFGALEEISDSIVDGLGGPMCYNMIVHIFRNREIDEEKGRGSAKTQVIQMFVRFDLPKPREIANEGKKETEVTVQFNEPIVKVLQSNGVKIVNPTIGTGLAPKQQDARIAACTEAVNLLELLGIVRISDREIAAGDKRNVEFTVALTPEHLAFLQSYEVYLPSQIIGHAIAPTKKEAEFEAYTRAFELLRQYGISTGWAEEAKQRRDFSDPAVARYAVAASERSKREGYISMYFFIPRKTVTPKGAIVQLVGVRENGQHVVLSYTYTTDRENSYRYAKSLVVQQYAVGGR